ncbi:MAG: glycoside hydrolase family 3 N-terminal domain-containing protein [Acidimicrobiales bacterium]
MTTSSPVSAATAGALATIEVDGMVFRDLDHDGRLAPYEDWRLPTAERADDLLARMTTDEKIGTLLHGSAFSVGPLGAIGVGDHYDLDALKPLVHDDAITSMICRLGAAPPALAEENNRLQVLAAEGRLGIPMTVSSDPRHHLGEVIGASVAVDGFTIWPETLGLAALRDADLVRQFGDCVRAEYRAVGFHMSLAPQADLATNPLWSRIAGTFGENATLARELVGAYVEGVQGGRSGAGRDGVAAVVKHWVGYGAARDGFDGHNHYGRFSAFPAAAFDDHVDAFRDAFDAKVAGVMPTYNILEGLELDGEPVEPVGAGFNRQLIDGLLRCGLGFDGLVLSDWAITRDLTDSGRTGEPPQTPADIAMPWGVEDLSRTERFAACINAGVDQIGGEDDPAPLRQAVADGLISLERLDAAARQVLVVKFELGLFDDPIVDVAAVDAAIRRPHDAAAAATAERQALVMLTGDRQPLIGRSDVVLAEGELADALARRDIEVTDDVAKATRAVVQVRAPRRMLHPGFFFGSRQAEGDLDFDPADADWQRLDGLLDRVPTTVVVHLDRPAVLTQLSDRAAAVFGEFGVSADALADVLTGVETAIGQLPFQLPASMAVVNASPCDQPGRDEDALFRYGHGGGGAPSA